MPFENPTQLTNFVELLSIILIPAALTYTYGRMVGRQRQGWAIFAAMLARLRRLHRRDLPGRAARHPRPARRRPPHHRLRRLDRRQPGGQGAAQRDRQVVALGDDHDGHLERLGQRRHRVATPASAAPCRCPASAPARSIFGGVGTGLYSMLLYVILAVFIGGLMVGRTPEYLGKKIQAREIKLVSLGVLFTPLAVLVSAGARHRRPRRASRRSSPERPAGLLGDPLRLPLAGQQQRLRLRRLHRLRPAQRARQRRLLRDHLRRPARRADDARRARFIPILFVLAVAGVAGRQEGRPGRRRARCGPTTRPSSSC